MGSRNSGIKVLRVRYKSGGRILSRVLYVTPSRSLKQALRNFNKGQILHVSKINKNYIVDRYEHQVKELMKSLRREVRADSISTQDHTTT